MYQTMNGSLFRALIDYGIRNLALHSEEINDLNIFPVPDGDTGTNMVTTTRIGYRAIESEEGDLRVLAKKFGGSVVYGARGNSGVIVSQFLKGFSEVFAAIPPSAGEALADCACFVRALENGVAFAYRAVLHPAEGTILTVVREATEEVGRGSYGDLSALLSAFLKRARVSLANTPNLLPVLKRAGVVDSGGMGIVYFFEGMHKYLNHEKLSRATVKEEAPAIDFGRFHRESTFELGYCTEGLLQLLSGREELQLDAFREGLDRLGTSVVLTEEGDKVKFHIHTGTPEQVLLYAHRFGEFLTLKIENMSVQHSERTKTLMVPKDRREGTFALVAVAPTELVAERFLKMGVDVVISVSEGYAPSTQDFLEAIQRAESPEVIVFPNNKNLILAAEQARDLSEDAAVTVIDSKSIAHCYASLAMIDLDAECVDDVLPTVRETVENVCAVLITRAAKDARYDAIEICKGDVIAMVGNAVIAAGGDVLSVAGAVIDGVMKEAERDTVTLFTGRRVTEEISEALVLRIAEKYVYTETDLVETGAGTFDLLLSFE